MYDPEEACKEGGEDGEEEETKENESGEKKTEGEPEAKTEENPADAKQVKQEDEDDDVVLDAETKAVSSPTPRRRGAVKNGAGPKSKKARK